MDEQRPECSTVLSFQVNRGVQRSDASWGCAGWTHHHLPQTQTIAVMALNGAASQEWRCCAPRNDCKSGMCVVGDLKSPQAKLPHAASLLSTSTRRFNQ